MKRSETIGNLAKALCAAQSAMGPLVKDRTAKIESQKGKYSYNYADLASVLDVVRKPLSDHGLAFVQPVGLTEGTMVVCSMLMHESGEWISEDYPVKTYERPQDQGSAITYARRYAAQAMLGLASEDDDGAAAQAAEPQRQPAKRAEPPQKVPDKPKDDRPRVTADEAEMIRAACRKAGIRTMGAYQAHMKELAGVDAAEHVAKADLSRVIDALTAMADESVTA